MLLRMAGRSRGRRQLRGKRLCSVSALDGVDGRHKLYQARGGGGKAGKDQKSKKKTWLRGSCHLGRRAGEPAVWLGMARTVSRGRAGRLGMVGAWPTLTAERTSWAGLMRSFPDTEPWFRASASPPYRPPVCLQGCAGSDSAMAPAWGPGSAGSFPGGAHDRTPRAGEGGNQVFARRL